MLFLFSHSMLVNVHCHTLWSRSAVNKHKGYFWDVCLHTHCPHSLTHSQPSSITTYPFLLPRLAILIRIQLEEKSESSPLVPYRRHPSFQGRKKTFIPGVQQSGNSRRSKKVKKNEEKRKMYSRERTEGVHSNKSMAFFLSFDGLSSSLFLWFWACPCDDPPFKRPPKSQEE